MQYHYFHCNFIVVFLLNSENNRSNNVKGQVVLWLIKISVSMFHSFNKVSKPSVPSHPDRFKALKIKMNGKLERKEWHIVNTYFIIISLPRPQIISVCVRIHINLLLILTLHCSLCQHKNTLTFSKQLSFEFLSYVQLKPPNPVFHYESMVPKWIWIQSHDNQQNGQWWQLSSSYSCQNQKQVIQDKQREAKMSFHLSSGNVEDQQMGYTCLQIHFILPLTVRVKFESLYVFSTFTFTFPIS